MPVSLSYANDDPWGEFVPERDRLRALVIHQHNMDHGVTNYLSGRFPKLKSLEIVISDDTVEVADIHAPQLRYLSLFNFVLRDLGAAASGNLTSLHLEFVMHQSTGVHAKPRFTLSAMLAMLRSCPCLTSLELRESLTVDAMRGWNQEDQQEAQLLHLQFLLLEEDVLVISRLLANLYIPACPDIQLPSSSDLSAVRQELPAIMRRCLQCAGWQPAHTLSLTLGSAGLYGSVNAGHASVPHGITLNCDLMLSLFLQHEWDGFPRMLNFCQAFSEHLLQGELKLSMYIASDEVPLASSSHFWPTIAALPALRELMIGPSERGEWESDLEYAPWAELLLALRVRGAPADDIPRPDKPFPALRKLVLKGFDLSRIVYGQIIQAHLLAFQEQKQREGCPVDIQPPVEELAAQLLEDSEAY